MPQILIIDDDLKVAESMRLALKASHQVEVNGDAQAALASLRSGLRYDAILCDLSMPGLNGIDLYQAVLAMDPAQARRIIFMTGGAYLDHIAQSLKNLDNPCLEKPYRLEQIRSLVDRVASAKL